MVIGFMYIPASNTINWVWLINPRSNPGPRFRLSPQAVSTPHAHLCHTHSGTMTPFRRDDIRSYPHSETSEHLGTRHLLYITICLLSKYYTDLHAILYNSVPLPLKSVCIMQNFSRRLFGRCSDTRWVNPMVTACESFLPNLSQDVTVTGSSMCKFESELNSTIPTSPALRIFDNQQLAAELIFLLTVSPIMTLTPFLSCPVHPSWNLRYFQGAPPQSTLWTEQLPHSSTEEWSYGARSWIAFYCVVCESQHTLLKTVADVSSLKSVLDRCPSSGPLRITSSLAALFLCSISEPKLKSWCGVDAVFHEPGE